MMLLRKSDEVTFAVVVLGYVCFTNGGACIDVAVDDKGKVVCAVVANGEDTVAAGFFGETSFIYTLVEIKNI